MTARMDEINPRTGMVIALCSVFLVFGFMFTMSGIKGETLGDVPLIAIGPAICLPGVAAIFIASRTKGCTVCPCRHRWPWRRGRLGRGDEDLEALGGRGKARSGEDSVSTTTTVGESSRLIRSVERDEVLRYLQACYPSSTFLTASEHSGYCTLARLCSARESTPYEAVRYSAVHVPCDSIVVFSRSRHNSSFYSSYCCYISPRDFNWDNETVV